MPIDTMYGLCVNATGSLQAPNNTITALLEAPQAFGKQRRLKATELSQTRALTKNWSIKSMGGGVNESDDVLDGTTGNAYISQSQPSRELYFTLWAGRAGLASADPGSINFLYHIDYLVSFWEFSEEQPMGSQPT